MSGLPVEETNEVPNKPFLTTGPKDSDKLKKEINMSKAKESKAKENSLA